MECCEVGEVEIGAEVVGDEGGEVGLGGGLAGGLGGGLGGRGAGSVECGLHAVSLLTSIFVDGGDGARGKGWRCVKLRALGVDRGENVWGGGDWVGSLAGWKARPPVYSAGWKARPPEYGRKRRV